MLWRRRSRFGGCRTRRRESFWRRSGILEGSITRFNRLAWPVRVSDAISVLCPQIPSSVTLTSITFVPHEDKPRASRKKKNKKGDDGAAEEEKRYIAIEIEGMAVDDLDVATLVSALEGHSLFSRVSLDYSRPRDVDGLDARGFRLSCRIDLMRRYAFVDSGSGEEAVAVSDVRVIPGVGLALMVALVAGLLIAPGLRESSRLKREIGAFRDELTGPNSGPEVIERLGDELATLRALADSRLTPIPDESDVSGLIRVLSSMLDELGLDRREITTGDSRQLDEASSMPMTVRLEGPFPSVAEAIRRIESLPRLVRVQRLRVESDQPRSGEMDRSGEVRAGSSG